jgi:hypothetical protein
MINRNFGSVDLAITYLEQNQPKQKEEAKLKEHVKNMLLGSFKDIQIVTYTSRSTTTKHRVWLNI